jgi:hypothetical protein
MRIKDKLQVSGWGMGELQWHLLKYKLSRETDLEGNNVGFSFSL